MFNIDIPFPDGVIQWHFASQIFEDRGKCYIDFCLSQLHTHTLPGTSHKIEQLPLFHIHFFRRPDPT